MERKIVGHGVARWFEKGHSGEEEERGKALLGLEIDQRAQEEMNQGFLPFIPHLRILLFEGGPGILKFLIR